MSAHFKWTPRGEASTIAVTLDSAGTLTRIDGYIFTDTTTNISIGRKAVSIIQSDSYASYMVEVRSIARVSAADDWSRLSSFVSHANAGGEFIFRRDTANDLDTTLSSGASKGAQTLSLVSTTNLASDDWLYIEDVDDPAKWELRQVSVPATTTIRTAITYGFGSGSIVRHFENFPKCVIVPGSIQFVERRGGKGANLWDFRCRLEAVR